MFLRFDRILFVRFSCWEKDRRIQSRDRNCDITFARCRWRRSSTKVSSPPISYGCISRTWRWVISILFFIL